VKLKVGKNSLIKLTFVMTILLDAYCFTTIGNRNFTVFYPLSIFVILFGLINLKVTLKGIARNPFSMLMVIYIPLNFFINGGVISSFLISMLLWTFYIMSYRNLSSKAFENIIKAFQVIMNVMAIYGIYQFVAHCMRWPFADIIFEGYMSAGYNWSNSINIAGHIFQRSNAIFREPSFFSQFLGISVLVYIQGLLDNPNQNAKSLMWMIIDLIAMLLSFSGTGVIITALGAILLLMFNKAQKIITYIKCHVLVVILVVIVAIGILIIPNSLNRYFFSRFAEFDSSNVESISAYIRFIKPYMATAEILGNAPFLGLGLGRTYNYTTVIAGNLNNALSVALPRAFAELGIIGGVLYVLFMLKAINKHNILNGSYKAVLIGTYLMTFMHGTWSSEVYWLFLALLNITIIDKTYKIEN